LDGIGQGLHWWRMGIGWHRSGLALVEDGDWMASVRACTGGGWGLDGIGQGLHWWRMGIGWHRSGLALVEDGDAPSMV
jgi:hypothetical protein